jgi:hypothetical protein
MKGEKIIKLLINTYNTRSIVLTKRRIKIYKYLNVISDEDLRYIICIACNIKSIFSFNKNIGVNIITKDILNNEWFRTGVFEYRCSSCYNK